MLLGKKGVKYGLQLNKGAAKTKGAPAPAAAAALPSIFAENDDDSDVEGEIQRQAAKKRSQLEIQQQHAAALQQDPNVFNYDAVYDDIREAREKPRQLDAEARESKYIGRLMAKAKEREREQDIIYERKLAKDREKEDHSYGDKDKFVTRAYKEKMAEQARFLEEEKKRDAAEAAQDVTKRADLSDFYRNLLKSTPTRALVPADSSETAHPRQSTTERHEGPGEGPGVPPPAAAGPTVQVQREPPTVEPKQPEPGLAGRQPRAAAAVVAEEEAEGVQPGSRHRIASVHGSSSPDGAEGYEGSTRARVERGRSGPEHQPQAVDPSPSPAAGGASKEQAAAAAVAAARERYQARKRQRVQS